MSRPIPARPDKDEGMDQLMQDEHDRLQNQLRVVQNERQKQANEFTVKLNKYHNELDLLNKENEDLRLWIDLMNSDQNRRKDSKIIKELKRILDEQDLINEKIEETKEENEKLDLEIKRLEKRIHEKQQQNYEQKKNNKRDGEMLAKLEEKNLMMEKHLLAKNNKFCETLKENEKLRADIDNKRLERKQFLELKKKLTDQLARTNKLKAEITAKATAAYEQRQEAVNRKMALQERNEKDRAAFDLEIKNLQRIIDHNEQLDKFMTAKSNERLKWKQDAEEANIRHGKESGMAQRQRRHRLEQFEAADQKLQHITGAKRFDGIIHVYRRREEDNFNQFKYVSELQNQIENLQDSIRSIEENIENCNKQRMSEEEKKQSVMHKFEVKMNSDKAVADEAEMRLAQINKVLDQVKSQIKSLVTKLGCDVKKIVDLMEGDGDAVTERNLVMYLSALEQRVDELLCIRSYQQSKDVEVEDSESHRPSSEDWTDSQAATKRQTISLPSVTDAEEDYDADSTSGSSVRPMTHSELMNRVKSDLKKSSLPVSRPQKIGPVH